MITKNIIENIYKIKSDWEKQIDDVRKGVGEKDKIEDLFNRTFSLKEVIPNDLSLFKEIDLLKKDRIIYTDSNGYISKCEETRYNKFLIFADKVIKELNLYPIKVYFDTNIISAIKDINVTEEDAKALELMTKNYSAVKIFTSEKTKREIDNYGDKTRRSVVGIIYNLIGKIPEQNLLKEESNAIGVATIGVAPIGAGSYLALDPLLVRLKDVFDINDAEHIFQAVKNNMDYFITFDKRTILTRAEQNKEKMESLEINMKFTSPSQFIKDVNLN